MIARCSVMKAMPEAVINTRAIGKRCARVYSHWRDPLCNLNSSQIPTKTPASSSSEGKALPSSQVDSFSTARVMAGSLTFICKNSCARFGMT